jgi:GNAT superfamily N-acetyltransferase
MGENTEERDLVLRPAGSTDAPLVLQLIRELAEFERLSDEVRATEDDLRRTLFGPRPAAEAILAFLDGAPVGFALFFNNYSTFLARPGLYLEDLYVRPGARGRGVGATLLRHLARTARQRGCGRLEWSVLDWNERAIRFYRRLGAEPMDGWTAFRLSGDALEGLAGGEP